MIGLDTCTVIDLFRGDEAVQRVLRDDVQYCISRFTYLELLFGLDVRRQSDKEELAFYTEFLTAVVIVEPDNDACACASSIFHNVVARGRQMSKFDCAIAGTFVASGVKTIITKNVKHFEGVKGLHVLSY